MIAKLLQRRLEPVAQRQRQWRFWKELAVCWLVLAVLALAFLLVKRFTGWGSPLVPWGLGFAAVFFGIRIWWRTGRWQPDYRQLARQIEQHTPELHALLLTAVEQKPDPASGEYHYLQERVIQQAIDESVKQRWIDTVSRRQMFWMRCGHLAALAALIALAINLPSVQPAPFVEASVPAGPTTVEVSPGDAWVERGSGLVVLARFTGPLPTEVNLVVGADTNTAWRVPLVKTLNDPVFGGSLREVNSNLTYHVEFGSQQSPAFKVTVFEHPRLERADAHLIYPSYTGLPEKNIPDTRRVTAVEGTKLELKLQLNKPVQAAALVARDKTIVPLTVSSNQPLALLSGFTIETNRTYDLQLIDEAGRTNKVPAQFVVEALPNRRPEIKIVAPRGDQRVSPLEEVGFQAEAVDDFGLRGYGLTWRMGGGLSNTLALGQSAPAGEKRSFGHLLKLEELRAQPDQLIAWFVWADDVGPDGQVRRTASDMYFLEVRPFEEIFREAQTPEGQSQQQQQQQNEAQKLAEQQKQVINATWKLEREQAGKPASEPYKKDAAVVKQSQENLLERVQAAKERVEDPRAQGLLEAVEKEMADAVSHLAKAEDSPAALAPAQSSEQAAYQALLKLAEREIQVARSRNRQQSQGMASRSQQQLDQLELKQEEDRYETQSQATPPQSPEQQEQLALLNRLKELAQRQQDLNEKIKELQAALQEAKTDEEREEIRRRLKRLREEQQEMLADLDELQQRMARSENQALTAEARKQLEKTRADVQRAAEALAKEEASQALASGTRAQRDLQQMRDEFRKKNASQFTEDMRQMRTEARDLAQKQENIGQKLDDLKGNQGRKTLTDSDQAQGLASQMEQQKGSLTNLLDNMRRVSDQAETSEPLLSKQLYDTLRKASQANTDNSLSLSQELLKKNFVGEAGQFEQSARADIQNLKRGVERAAESVLGDETEALRQAGRELDDLHRQIENEIAQANPSAQSRGSQSQTNQQAGAQGRRGQRQSQQGQGQGQRADQQAQAQGEPSGEEDTQGQAEARQPGEEGQAQAQQRSGQRGNQQGQQGQQAQRGDQPGEQPGEGQPAQGQGDDAQQGDDPANQTARANQQGNRQGQQQQQQDAQGQQGQQGQGQQPQNAQAQQGRQGQGQQNQNQQAQNAQGQQGQQGQQAQQGQQGQPNQNAQAQQGQPGQGQGQPQQAQTNPQQAQNGQGQGTARNPDPTTQPPRETQPRDRTAQSDANNPQGTPGRDDEARQPGRRQGDQRAQFANPERGAGGRQQRRGDNFFDQADGAEGSGPARPLTGADYENWSERLGNVEEMVDEPDLRTDLARIRERARAVRSDFKRHGKSPQWDLVRTQIAGPLAEVRDRVSEELQRRESKDALVPIDRDPVPTRYSDLVRRYYEKLGQGNRE